MARKIDELYPDFNAEIEEIKKNGIDAELLQKIIKKHEKNRKYNKMLYERYMTIEHEGKQPIPIFKRQMRFEEEKEINNKINNDFFSEGVDFKTGYFAGSPITYGYSKGEKSEAATGGENAIDEAVDAITNFVTRNNMYGVDMETTKLATIYGYCGRLFYIDPEGTERIMPVQGFETIVLSCTDISEPEYAIRLFQQKDINGTEKWVVEFYDEQYIHPYRGNLSNLEEDGAPSLHLFDYCPLQGIANNRELMGDMEKVISLIDDYDKVLSDNSNEIEAFVHAYMIFENLMIDDKVIQEGKKAGSFVFSSTGTQQGKAYFLTKDINDAFTEHHLNRLQDNIYRFSKTPNLNDENFGQASGVAMKFKLHGLETKCGMFQSKMMDAAQHMWRLLSSSWAKKKIKVDPLFVTMEFTRNFPLDIANEAQTVQALIAAGLPKEVAFQQLSFVDDVDYIMEMIENEKDGIPSLVDDIQGDVSDSGDKTTNAELNQAEDGAEKVQLLNGAQIQALTGIVQNVANGVLSRSAAITMAITTLGISRANAEAMIEDLTEEKKKENKNKKEVDEK